MRRARQDPAGVARALVRLLLNGMRSYIRGFYALAGLFLSAGFVLALLGLWGLGALTESVLEGDTLRFDKRVLLWMNAHATEWLDIAALEVTALGDILVVLTITAVAGALLFLLGQRAYAGLIAVAVGGAWIINPMLKSVFDRPRPQLFEWRAHYAGLSSFPSGHATMSMVLFVVLAYVIHRLAERRWMEIVAMVLAGTYVLLIGVSRLYLGVHYPSDVLAGYVVGFSWAIFCALAIEVLGAMHRPSQRDQAVFRDSSPDARDVARGERFHTGARGG